ncbi:hypothetical protein V6U90_26965 [Micromonospora sp. CPCC 206060]|uniref:WXG100 family type VII secretion target n=1 Tax=Micromonospora sp. CPCC 206060 TaxID=3122406 RepID=UPI002FF2C304
MAIPNNGIVADEATITGMVMAFAQAKTEAKNSHMNVVAATQALTASWSSDMAAPKFIEAVRQWLTGFQTVQMGLDMLNQNMEQYAQLTTTTEDDSAMQAGNWATADGGVPDSPANGWVPITPASSMVFYEERVQSPDGA